MSFQITLTFTILPDKPTYTQRELVTLKGNVTDDTCCKGLVQSGLVGIQVENPLSTTISMRTLPLTNNNTENFPVEIVSLFMCDDGGNYKANIERDKNVYFKVVVKNKVWFEDRNMYISITIADKNLTPLETSQTSKAIPRGNTSYSMSRMYIPKWAAVGTAFIFATVYTDWPNDFGYPLCPEKTAYFNIIESVYVVPPITIPPTEPMENGTFEMKLALPPDMIPGLYLVSAAAWHNGTYKSAFTSFNGNYTSLPPWPSFAAMPPSTRPNNLITFEGKFSSPEGYNDSIKSYSWTFGDGKSGTGIKVTHSYTKAGIYTATLTVQDNEGFWNTTAKQILIGTIINKRTQVSYPTFQDAINGAIEGDTIYAFAGTYYENMIVNKRVTLEGENKKTTIVDAKGIGHAIYITANNVTIKNLTIRNSSELSYVGIYLQHCGNAAIENNNIATHGYGVYLNQSSNNKIVGNNLVGNQNGIFQCNSSNNIIYHNNFINTTISDVGFHPPSSTGIIWDNGCEGNYWDSYDGEDLDSDGIGETKLPWLGIDNYPLMNPYIPGDVNHDCVVDIYDVTWVSVTYGSKPGDPTWNPQCNLVDVYGEIIIDIFDLSLVCICYASVWSYP
jgi:parallel beta-helix repeat protein